MIKYCTSIFILLIILIACNKNAPQKPEDLISKNKMANILYDMYIINAAKGVNKKMLENNGVAPEAYILKKYTIDSTQFANSNNYYSFVTNEYNKIIETVKIRLEKEKVNFETFQKVEEKEKKRKRDSLHKANQHKIPRKIKPDSTLKRLLRKT